MEDEETDFAVFTIDSYLSAGAEKGTFPGSIVMVLDETQGGDAVVAHESVFDSIQSLDKSDTRFVLTLPTPPASFWPESFWPTSTFPQSAKTGWNLRTDPKKCSSSSRSPTQPKAKHLFSGNPMSLRHFNRPASRSCWTAHKSRATSSTSSWPEGPSCGISLTWRTPSSRGISERSTTIKPKNRRWRN